MEVGIIIASGMMLVLGLIIGIVLAIASKVFYVYVDPKVMAVDDALPGANCGGCGLPGCSANAEAIVAGTAAPNSCVAGGPDLAEIIAGILGVTVEAKEPDIALPGCAYGVDKADLKFAYDGISDCRAASLLSGGMKICNIGCLGLGTCAKACPFGAITMGEDNLPKVDESRCTGCGTCERVCPKHIITLSSVTRRIIREYTTDDCTTPCQRTCPAGIDIREYIHQISTGDYFRAVQVIKERNPFPTVIGRICPRPCETECRRKHVDEPVAINALKRFAADYERSQGKRIQPFKAPSTGRKIAVVGGGIEGLSTAFFAARIGHEPTVFEATDKLGGLLRTAIARNRLPMDILDWDIEGILEMGVTAKTGQALGKDFSIDSLLGEGFQAVFLASGGWDSRLARKAGGVIENPIPGIYLLIDLLKATETEKAEIEFQNNVVIAGGESAALKAAVFCKEKGAGEVTVLFREKEDALDLDDAHLDAAKQAGVSIAFEKAITRLTAQGSRLSTVECIDLADADTTTEIPAETLLLAAGRFPEMIFSRPVAEDSDAETNGSDARKTEGWVAVLPYKAPFQTGEVGLLADGDPLTDISAAIKAIAAGRRGASSIHQILYDFVITTPENVLTPDSAIQDVDRLFGVTTSKRTIMPLRSTAETRNSEELEKGFTESMAREEAGRCLQCGLICYERNEAAQVQIIPSYDHAIDKPAAVSSTPSTPAAARSFRFEDHGRIV